MLSKLTAEVEQQKLVLGRLNSWWSFTGSELSWRLPLYLRESHRDPLQYLLHGVKCYANLGSAAGRQMESGWVIPEEWDRLYKIAGQKLLFELSSHLSERQRRKFIVDSSKSFVLGWMG